MYCGNNKIALASQKQIMDALMRLLKEKKFSDITVSQLCKEAEVSRQTFYSLYESKENVVKDLIAACQSDPEAAHTAHGSCCQEGSASTVFSSFGRYLSLHRDLMQMLSDNDILYLLYQSLYSAIIGCEFFLHDEQKREREYAANFIAGGFTGIATAYVNCGTEDIPEYLEREINLLFRGNYLK